MRASEIGSPTQHGDISVYTCNTNEIFLITGFGNQLAEWVRMSHEKVCSQLYVATVPARSRGVVPGTGMAVYYYYDEVVG